MTFVKAKNKVIRIIFVDIHDYEMSDAHTVEILVRW